MISRFVMTADPLARSMLINSDLMQALVVTDMPKTTYTLSFVQEARSACLLGHVEVLH